MTSTSALPVTQPRLAPQTRRVLPWVGVFVLAVIGATGLAGALGPVGARNPAAVMGHRAGAKAPALAPVGAPVGSTTNGTYTFTEAAPPAPTAMDHGLSAAGAQPAAAGAGGASSARIEETGSITVVVKGAAIQDDINDLTNLAVGSGGFVASTSTQSTSPGVPAQGSVTLQVPEGNFATVLSEVKTLGAVAALSTSAVDVTGQYVDLQAQITAAEDSRQQYLTIMTKATTIGGILAVQSQLDNLQSQLDQLQGQLKTLNTETTYATLVVTLSQRAVTPPPPRPASGLLKAWRSAVSGFVSGFEGVVRLAGPVLFALLLVGALALAGRLAWRLARRSPTGGAVE